MAWLLSIMALAGLIGLLPGLPLPLLAATPRTTEKAPLTKQPANVLAKNPPHAAIATEHELATRAAMRVIKRGGNAVDAAVAAALVTGVVAPSSSGLGGGGFALLWLASKQESLFVDFRETAPKKFVEGALDARPLSAPERGRAIGVPGEPAGLYELQRRYGRLAFRDVTSEASRLAEQGFPVGAHLARVVHGLAGELVRRELFASLSFPLVGVAAGQRVRFPALAKTLESYGKLGKSAIVQGAIAADVVRAAQTYKSSLSESDLRDYVPVERQPLRAAFGRFVVVTAPPPSAGGLLLLQTLGKFTSEELASQRTPDERIHLLAEAYRQSLADRFEHLGDPAYVSVELDALLDSRYLKAKRQQILLDKTQVAPAALPREHGTSHISVVDREGNGVALTTTINNAFGAKVVAPKSGIVLNDELDDFGESSGPNGARAGARPVSSMTPTLVFEGSQLRYVLGGSGGMAISTNVTTTLLSMLVDGLSPKMAVEQPRFTLVPRESLLVLERGFPREVVARLKQRGEPVQYAAPGISGVQVLGLLPSGWQAAADPRKHGFALVE